jgi:hypothetical protein
MGRKKALSRAKQRLADIANRIKGQYFIWQAKKIARVLRAEATERRVVRIQCQYRTRLARRYVTLVRFMHHTRMATKIESVVRGRLGRKRFAGIKRRLRRVFDRMTLMMMRDIRQSQARIKPTAENIIGNTERSSPWEMLETILFQIIGTMRRDIAVDLGAELQRKHSSFYYGRFALQVALFLTWTCSGSTNHVRMDLGAYRLRWELHTEFVSWTFMRPVGVWV